MTPQSMAELEFKNEKERQANFLKILLIGVIGLNGFAILAILIFTPFNNNTWRTFLLFATVLTAYSVALYLNKRGHTGLAAHLTCYIYLLQFFTYFIGNVLNNDIKEAIMMAVIMMLVIIIAAMIIGHQAVIWFAILNTASIGLASFLIPTNEMISFFVPLFSYLVMISTISWLFQKTMEDARRTLLKARLEKEVTLEQEIIERKQIENSSRESQQMLQLILDHFPVRVFWKDKALNFMGCNQLHANDRGLSSPDEIVGKNDYDFFPVAEADLYRIDDHKVINSGKAKLNFEEPQTRFDGATRWLRTSKVPLRDAEDEIIGILGTYEDITKRKQAEEEIHRQNRELTLLNRVIAASATQQNQETILQTVCHELAQAFDTPQALATLLNEGKTTVTIVAEYAQGNETSILNQIIPLENNAVAQHLLTHKTPLAVADAPNDPRFAELYDIFHQFDTNSILLLPLIINQEVIGSLSIATTETRHFSDEEITLAQRVAEQVTGALIRVRLEQKNRQLEEQHRQGQKMEAIGRLAGGMAHDFNNLLTVITGYCELLLLRHMDENDPQLKDVEQIYKAGQRATALTRQLLAFSRRQVIEPKVLDLNTTIVDINKMLRRLISENIELVTTLEPTLGQIKADPGQIEQIIMNMVVNARDAMPQGGTLTLQTTNVDLNDDDAGQHLDLEPGSYIKLTISDTGAGMDEETLSHIFEPFYTTKEKGKGTGLGLAIVYGIVRQNNGYILVFSKPGQGTTFQIYFPHYTEKAQPMVTRETLAKPEPGSETILLVEDEDMVRELTRRALQQHGYQILEARHGPEALKICQEYQDPIHLLLTDVVMPKGLSGHDLALQVTPLHPETKILYMSGYVDDDTVKNNILNADAAFLQKPFSPVDLSRKVREVLDS